MSLILATSINIFQSIHNSAIQMNLRKFKKPNFNFYYLKKLFLKFENHGL